MSEYSIAKEKKEKENGLKVPLKYTFITMIIPLRLIGGYNCFSYNFDHHHTLANLATCDKKSSSIIKTNNTNANNCNTLIKHLREKLIQRDHVDMLLNSNATRNEDRFNAILPSWNGYSQLIKDKNTISKWQITNMISVRLKLFGIMNNLRDKSRLLHACSTHAFRAPILPTFASYYSRDGIYLYEVHNLKTAYDRYLNNLSKYVLNNNNNNKDCEEYINLKKIYIEPPSLPSSTGSLSVPMYKSNLKSIQLKSYYLSIRPSSYFIIKKENRFDQAFLSIYSLKMDNSLKYIFIPFFTHSLLSYYHIPPLNGSGIYILGNTKENRWIVISKVNFTQEFSLYSVCSNGYEFNIY
ncbi:hypothetical protein BJ944DRAFT_272609 [Cunninghamella echinulata]|nr:hypothetical protein BJ944DRAFT_272609 [Cunninghamella echinulata]